MNAKLVIVLTEPYGGQMFQSVVEVSDYMMEQLSPVDLCRDPISAMLSGSRAVSSVQMEVVRMTRAELIKVISDNVTRQLVDFIESRDLEQGYSKQQLARGQR